MGQFKEGQRVKIVRDKELFPGQRSHLTERIGTEAEVVGLRYAPESEGGYLEIVSVRFDDGQGVAYWPSDLEDA